MKKQLGLWTLVGTGVSSIIGSGWLFSAYRAAKYAGTGSILAWILGGFIAMLLALTIAEISSFYPKRGLFTRLLTLSHNRDMGYITALANWLSVVAILPTEAMATVEYLSSANASWQPYLHRGDELTSLGLAVVSMLVFLYAILNYWGVKWLARSNNVVTVFKVVVLVITAVAVILVSFHPNNFVAYHENTLSNGISSIFAAIITGGIVYAFNGFQTIASFCAETKDAGKTVPKALVLSILVCLIIYLLLQVSFIGGMPPSELSNGWSSLDMQSPIVELTSMLGLHFTTLLLYIGACVSPSGSGIVYAGASSRMVTAMSEEKQLPQFFNKIDPVHQFSRRSLVFNILLSLGLLWIFPSWGALMMMVSLFLIVSYMSCPLALMRLRVAKPDKKRTFRMPFAHIVCPLLFMFVTLLFCLTPEKNLIVVTAVIVIFYGMYIVISNQGRYLDMLRAVKRSCSLILYFMTLTFLGLLGNPKEGGFDLISHELFYSLMVVVSLGFYYWMVYKQSNDAEVESK